MDPNHLLWDDTIAGPKPDRIPGKNVLQHLNNYGGSGSGCSSSTSILARSAPPPPLKLDLPVITRSITILKPNSSAGHDSSSSSVPSSPAGSSSSPSSSPFSPRTPQFDSKGLLTRMKPKTMTKKSVHEPRTPTVYDWVVISALDR